MCVCVCVCVCITDILNTHTLTHTHTQEAEGTVDHELVKDLVNLGFRAPYVTTCVKVPPPPLPVSVSVGCAFVYAMSASGFLPHCGVSPALQCLQRCVWWWACILSAFI